MSPIEDIVELEKMHTPQAIAARIAATTDHSYLGDLVLGAVDGAVTTFAIVAGAAGASLPTGVALVLGLANILADAFSMAASNFLKSRSDQQNIEKFRRMEERHIDLVPEAEREEIRQIFAAKGFTGDLLEKIVVVITQDREQWVNTMLTEEWGLQLDAPSPFKAAISTFAAFVMAGMIPLVPLLSAAWLVESQLFAISAVLTGITFFAIGLLRGKSSDRKVLASGWETLWIGGTAASLAYLVGVLLKRLAVG